MSSLLPRFLIVKSVPIREKNYKTDYNIMGINLFTKHPPGIALCDLPC